MIIVSLLLTVMTLNAYRLNSPIKRCRLAQWIKKKQDPTLCCLQVTHFSSENTHRLQVKNKKIFYANGNQKRGVNKLM